MQWTVLFQKEIIENWRNRKWVWVPLVFMLLTIIDPISTYYLPQIIEFAGGLPEGAVIEIPKPSSAEVVMMSLEQLSMFGVLIIIFMSMGTIVGERKSGVSELILVKPIKYSNYITSKWASFLLLIWISLILALGMSWYYIIQLFGDISISLLFKTILFYGLWFTLIITLSIFYNTIARSPGIVSALTVITILIMSLFNLIFGYKLSWFPNQLSEHIYDMLLTGTTSTELIMTGVTTIILSFILIVCSIFIFRLKEKTR